MADMVRRLQSKFFYEKKSKSKSNSI